MIGPTALFLSSHVLYVHSLFRWEESDADKLPAVGSTGGLCSTAFSHRLFIDKFCALQNGPPNGSEQILTTLKTLRNGLVPSGRRFVRYHRQHPHFYLNGMATQPTAANILVDRKRTPETANAVARAKFGTSPISWLRLHRPHRRQLRWRQADLRLYDFLKEQDQKASHLMICANIHDNPQQWPGRTRSPFVQPATGYKRRNISKQSRHRHADWMTNTAAAYCRL